MRLAATLAAGLFAVAAPVLAAAPSQALPVGESVQQGWMQTGSAVVFTATSVQPGTVPGRAGNWHTLVVSVNGDDGVTGMVTDWTCPDGVAPNYQDNEIAWACRAESRRSVASVLDETGTPLLHVDADPTGRSVVVRAAVLGSDTGGDQQAGTLVLKVHASGEVTRSVTRSHHGHVRRFDVVQPATRVHGRVLGITLRAEGAQVESSALISQTSWRLVAPATRSLLDSRA